MIFYLSGTGNSLHAAKVIGEDNGLEVVSIPSIMNKSQGSNSFSLGNGEAIGFVFPIYAWGPPGLVLEFIESLKFTNFNNNYIFAIATCGGSAGNGMQVLEKALAKKNIKLSSAFTVQMPNNYMIMGDVDFGENMLQKVKRADERILRISEKIKNREQKVFELEKGPVPSLLTHVVNPMFTKHACDIRKFTAVDTCTSCGICAEVCSCQSIQVQKKPVWQGRCIQCLACINLCPVKAIQYGKGTAQKGRYKHPDIKIEELKMK